MIVSAMKAIFVQFVPEQLITPPVTVSARRFLMLSPTRTTVVMRLLNASRVFLAKHGAGERASNPCVQVWEVDSGHLT